MTGSSQETASANKDSGPTGSETPNKGVTECPLNKPPKILAQTVTPVITVVKALVWFHATVKPEKNEIGQITLKATKQGDELYTGKGTFTAGSGNVAFFSDSTCGSPLNLPAEYALGALVSGVQVYYKGTLEGTAGLVLTLAAATDDRVTVNPAAQDQVEAKEANVVTPKIELEYKVALLDRKPHTGAVNADNSAVTAIPPTPTYMQLSYTESKPGADRKFAGKGKLTGTATNLDMYTLEDCATAATLDALKDTELKAATLKLWARGKAVSTAPFDLTLTLESTADDPWIRIADPVKEKFNVGELKMVLHKNDHAAVANLEADPDTAAPDPYSLDKQLKAYHDKLEALVIPDQKAMTDAEKTGEGRFLHAQNAGSFARAKLVLTKLEAGQWPAETDAYTLALGNDFTSGAVSLFTTETGTDAAPATITVADLKAAEKIVWVEGTTDTDKRVDARLQFELNRTAGGLAHTVKKNGDWARFTVVTISEVKIFYTPETDKPVAWDETEKRFYINFKDDPDGRKIKIRAKLSKNIPGVKVHLMLAPHKDNMKTANWGTDLPDRDIKLIATVSGASAPSGSTAGKSTVSKDATDTKFLWKWNTIHADLKHKDKDARTKILHMSEKTVSDSTNAFAYAEKELILSRFGGDRFTPMAYIDEDPHLAKYVAGHTELEKRVPATSNQELNVWRKFWYQRIAVEGVKDRDGFRHADMASSITGYKAVKVVLEKTAADHDITETSANGWRAIYPRYLLVQEETDLTKKGLVLTNSNKGNFWPTVVPPKTPLRVPINVCDAQWDDKGGTKAKTMPAAGRDKFANVPTNNSGGTAFALKITTNKDTIDPPISGGTLFTSGNYSVAERIGDTGAFTDVGGDVAIVGTDVFIPYQQRKTIKDIHVKWPAAVKRQWVLSAVAIAAPGAGATAGAVATLTGAAVTAATVTIGTVGTTGEVTAITVTEKGRYDSDPGAGPIATSVGGLTVTPTWVEVTKTITFKDIVVQGAEDFLGECSGGKLLAVYDPTQVADFTDTVIHECGHAFWQVPPGTPPGASSTHATIPAHPNAKNLGKGNHCWYEAGKQTTERVYTMASVAVAAGGTGYASSAVNKVGELSGGKNEEVAEIKVTAVSGGAVTGVRLWDAGKYTSKPPNPVTVPVSGGTGLTVTVTWVEKDSGTSMKDSDAIAPCVMYDSGPQALGIHKFCDVCAPYMLAQDMAKFKE